MAIFFLVCISLILGLFFLAEIQKKKDFKLQKVDSSSFVGLKGFFDVDCSVFLDENKQAVPGLSTAYFDKAVSGRGIRYVPCVISEIRGDGMLRVYLEPYQVKEVYKVIYTGDFGIILHHDFYGDLFLGDFNLIPDKVKVGDAFNVSIIPEKTGHAWYVDYEISKA